MQPIKQPYPASIAWTNLDAEILTSNGIKLSLEPNQVIKNNILNSIANCLKGGVSYDYCQNLWISSIIGLDSTKIIPDYESIVFIIKCNQMYTYLEECLFSICSQTNSDISIKVIVVINDLHVGRYKPLTRKYIENVEFYYTSNIVGDDILTDAAIEKIISYDSLIVELPTNTLLPPSYLNSLKQIKHNLSQHALYSLPILSLECELRNSINLSEMINQFIDDNVLKNLDYADDVFLLQAFSLLLGNSSFTIKERLAQIINDKIRFENKSWRMNVRLCDTIKPCCFIGSYHAFKRIRELKLETIEQLDILPLLYWKTSEPIDLSEQFVKNISLYKLQ